MGRICMPLEKDGRSGMSSNLIMKLVTNNDSSSIDTKTEAIDIRKKAHE
jgi:hypothetical protein